MSKELIIRAWRDEEYLLSLTDEQRALLPANPAGLIELTDEELEPVAGGAEPIISRWVCTNLISGDDCFC